MAAHRPVVLAGGRFKQLPPGDELDTPAKWDALKAPAIAGGALTIDLATPAGFRVALNQNVATLSFANVPTGRVVVFTITWVQDATGGRTVAFPANVKADGGGAPVQPAAGANAVTVQSFYTDDGGATVWQAGAGGQGSTDYWASLPIGLEIPIDTSTPGVAIPPTDNPNYRYIKLTASDSYNTGVLISESVSGSAPLVQATAVISDPGSPMNGQTVRLINTERRFIRPGSNGTVEADALQNITGNFRAGRSGAAGGAFASGGGVGTTSNASANGGEVDFTFDASRVVRTSNETRVKSVGRDYFRRIR
nr:hypothetical protein [uncultured Pseudomonas sp.]